MARPGAHGPAPPPLADGILLPPVAMAAVDRAAIAAGTPGILLMERAGRAVARALVARLPRQRVMVLAGPGNNGGDGFVAARLLAEAGWPVRLALLGEVERLTGDAALAARRWTGPVARLEGPDILDGDGALVIDALFGAGLSRPLDGVARAVVEALARRRTPVLAVDTPSGIDGATGAVRGAAAPALVTVTFCRLKPGHLLQPGRGLMGEIVLADIGIPDSIVAAAAVGCCANRPGLWRDLLPVRDALGHKYRFGHALVMGGGAASSGAARLSARAALRIGAGLVSVATGPEALPTYAATLTSIMTKLLPEPAALEALVADPRLSAFLIGPGYGVGAPTRQATATLLATGRPLVLDADALTSLAAEPGWAESAGLHERCVLTPHDGELKRLFPALEGDRLSRAKAAAAAAGGVVLLKGADTVVATPDGRAAIATLAAPWLATAGTGDVLAGMVLGLLAQGVPAFEAAAAAVWLHTAAARAAGPGMIAEDLPDLLPIVTDKTIT